MIRGIFFLTVVAVLAGTFSTIEAAGSEEGKAGRINVLTHDSLARDGADSAAVTGDSVLDTSTAVLPLCTLEIVTEPEGAAVLLDGKEVGASPLIVADVDTGKHTLLIKKTGYYQKKATILLTSDRKTTLRFSLSAPGSLTIVTEPPEAAVSINGERIPTRLSNRVSIFSRSKKSTIRRLLIRSPFRAMAVCRIVIRCCLLHPIAIPWIRRRRLHGRSVKGSASASSPGCSHCFSW